MRSIRTRNCEAPRCQRNPERNNRGLRIASTGATASDREKAHQAPEKADRNSNILKSSSSPMLREPAVSRGASLLGDALADDAGRKSEARIRADYDSASTLGTGNRKYGRQPLRSLAVSTGNVPPTTAENRCTRKGDAG
ncbi:hypothetical protein MRX96_009310 [Rhipicephalus microplus]